MMAQPCRRGPSFFREEEEVLIELVAQNPVLYDYNHPGYKDKEFRNMVWHFIGLMINKEGEACRRRWRTLRDAYKRVKRQRVTCGRGRWVHETRMKFIEHSKERKYSHCYKEDFESKKESMTEYVQHFYSKPSSQVSHFPPPIEIVSNHNYMHGNDQLETLTADKSINLIDVCEDFAEVVVKEERMSDDECDAWLEPGLSDGEQKEITKAQGHEEKNDQTTTNYVEDEVFCLILTTCLRNLPSEKKALAKMKIQEILYDICSSDELRESEMDKCAQDYLPSAADKEPEQSTSSLPDASTESKTDQTKTISISNTTITSKGTRANNKNTKDKDINVRLSKSPDEDELFSAGVLYYMKKLPVDKANVARTRIKDFLSNIKTRLSSDQDSCSTESRTSNPGIGQQVCIPSSA